VAARTVLCYGDSNTYGWDARTGGRFPRDIRWPGVLAAQLGDTWHVIEEGLGGRTTVHDDPFLPHANGLTYLVPCLQSHAPLDVVVVFLGVNDLKPYFGLPAAAVARGVGLLVQETLAAGVGPDGSPPRMLVLGLPRLGRFDPDDELLEGVAAKAERLPKLLARTATDLGVEFLDLAPVTAFGDVDGRHLDAAGHAAIGRAVAAALA
jgi:lysophospholipase L1-like esterase